LNKALWDTNYELQSRVKQTGKSRVESPERLTVNKETAMKKSSDEAKYGH
jgi:hypothetical protein